MRDDSRARPEVLRLVAAENGYAAARLAPLARLAGALADEMDAPLPSVERRAPAVSGAFEYVERRGPEDDHWDVYRRPAGGGGGVASAASSPAAAGATSRHQQVEDNDAGWQLAGPFNRLSQGHSYFDVAHWAASPDSSFLAFAVDTRGDEEFTVYALRLPLGGGSSGISSSRGGSSRDRDESDDHWRGPAAPALIARGAAGGGQLVWAPDSRHLFVLDQPGSNEKQGGSETRVVRRPVGAAGSGGGEASGEDSGSGAGPAAGAVLLRLPPGALDLELAAGSSGAFLMLRYSDEDGDVVVALAMTAAASADGLDLATTTDSKRGVSSSVSSPSSSPGPTTRSRAAAATAAAAAVQCPGATPGVTGVTGWRCVLAAARGQDCLQMDHWRGDTFVLVVDDELAPDGRLELVTLPASPAASPTAATHAAAAKDGVRNGSSSSSSERRQWLVGGDSTFNTISSSGGVNSSSNGPRPGSIKTVEIREFALTNSRLAVLIRRGGASVIQVFGWEAAVAAAPDSPSGADYDDGSSSSSGGSSGGEGDAAGAEAASKQQQQQPWLPKPSWELSFGPNSTSVVSLSSVRACSPTDAGDVEAVRLSEQSFVSPVKLYDLDLVKRSKRLLFEERMSSKFVEGEYESKMEWATSHDGVKVPVTVSWRRDKLRLDGSNPAILWGYGAYGSKQFPSFNPADLALLDRGFVLAIGHVRGGSELGAEWHAGGKKVKKTNTFLDLLACARHLAATRYTSPCRLALWGRSAGGLAVAAALNLQPDCCGAAVLDVPFLDVLRTMLDTSLLLTVKERGEWGDPLNDEAAFKTISSYTPYDNVKPDLPYPHLLVTASLWDRRVNFWEPLKYVAKLRYFRRERRLKAAPAATAATAAAAAAGPVSAAPAKLPAPAGALTSSSKNHDDDSRWLLIKTDLEAGHFAASGAGERLRQRAEKAAFLIHVLGVENGY